MPTKQYLQPSLLLWLVIGFLCLSACSKDDATQVTNKLNLRHKGAEMPIWVRGNLTSGKLILFLYGGPGDCAMCYQYYLKDLEKQVAVAYWDQRIAGSSSGKVDPTSLTYEQFGEDAYYVVKLLREQFPETKIYLLGHSFGVELGWQFLTTGNNQQMVSGFMAVNGTFSTYRWLYQLREWVIDQALKQQNEQAKQFALANEVTPQSLQTIEWPKLYQYMKKLGGNPVSLYEDKKFLLDYLFASPNTPLGQFTHAGAYWYYDQQQIRGYEKSEELKKITIPVALMWGSKDGVVPIAIASETETLLESSSQISLVTFDDSWHEPFITEQDKFVREVLKFVSQ